MFGGLENRAARCFCVLAVALVVLAEPLHAVTPAGADRLRPESRPAELQASIQRAARSAPAASVRPALRTDIIPVARWDAQPQGQLWTRATMRALRTHGSAILHVVPRDIAAWCPAYPEADLTQRAAFWTGLMSTLAKHESTYRQTAVGGGGRWYGLLQILPATARSYKCSDPSVRGLKNGPSNLSCAVRIMAKTVPRDEVVAAGMRGVAADWGPFHSRKKREDMRQWVRRQDYCKPAKSIRPRARAKPV